MADPVLLMGIPSEPPLAMVAAALERLQLPYCWFNQRDSEAIELAFAIQDGEVTGVVQAEGELLPLEAFGGVYTRLMDHRLLPELRGVDPADPRHRHAERLHWVTNAWTEVTPARVVNRSRAQVSNGSKPYQAQLIAAHFAVPRTLVTNDPGEALAFGADCGRMIYKSISGTRSVVREFSNDDLERLERLRACPAQFQEHVEGFDLRVHTIGDQLAFATRVDSDASDYRYSERLGAPSAQVASHELDDSLAAACVDLAGALGLAFAGLDLRIAPNGTAYCFEVNPSPAFSYFEEATGQPIAEALARYLAGA